eukprot:2473788-Pleurochrysis_carterae.AAC.4
MFSNEAQGKWASDNGGWNNVDGSGEKKKLALSHTQAARRRWETKQAEASSQHGYCTLWDRSPEFLRTIDRGHSPASVCERALARFKPPVYARSSKPRMTNES